MVGGGVASETDAIESVQFLAEELQAITRTVKQMSGGKRMVTAHAYTAEAIRHAIDNGVLGIEHGNLLDEPTAKLMADRGIFLTPTLSCYGIMTRAPFEGFLSADSKVKNAQVMRKGLDALVLAEKHGVTVCYGTDLLGSMTALQTEEFYVRSTVLPAPAILRQATVNPAKMLRMEGKLGIIAPGAFADLLVLSKNPLVRFGMGSLHCTMCR
jgi:imidazolonepropionase-like amidohydrolase